MQYNQPNFLAILRVIGNDSLTSNLVEVMQKPFTVLQVLPELRAGGVERGTIEVAKALKEHGNTPLVASAGGAMVSQLKAMGVKHITLPLQSKNYFAMRRNADLLEDIIKEHQVDIVHARSRAPAWSAYWAAKSTNCPFVTTFHGTYGASNCLKRYYNSVMTRGDRVIAVSGHIQHHIETLYPKCQQENVRLVHRGADINVFSPEHVTEGRMQQLAEHLNLPDGVPVIMLPGRITRWKGQELLLDALKLVKERVSEPFYCLLVGDYGKKQQYKAKLEKKIIKNRLESDVRVIGHISDMAALYMLSDIVISASTEPEAFGRVAVEGQAMGRMVIASNHGGSKETVAHQVTGWLVEPGNVEELAQAIQHALLLNDEEKKRITSNAIRHVREQFTTELMIDKTLAVYKELL